MRKHSNTSAFIAYSMVGVLCAAISFVTMIVLTRTVSEDFFGKINKFITASNLIMSLICVGLDSAYIRFYYEPPPKTNHRQLAWKCMTPPIMILIAISIIILLIRNSSSLILLLGGGGFYFATAFIITVLSQFFYRFMTIYFRMSSKILNFFIISIVFVVFTKTIFIPIYYLTPKFEQDITLAAPILSIFTVLIFLFNMNKMVEVSHSPITTYKPVYRYALFSSPVFIIIYLNSYLPQIIISNSLGDNFLGIYSAASLFCSAILVLSTGFSTFWSPYMYKNYKSEQDTIKQIHNVVLLGSVLVLSLILFFSDYFYLFIGETFRKNQNILGLLLIHPIILIVVETVACGIGIKKKNEITLVIYLISTAINVALCFILVSTHGLAGIAFASMISALVQFILMTYFGQKYYRSIKHIARTLLHIVVLILSAILFYFLYDNRPIFIFIEIAMLVICMFCDRDVIVWGRKQLKTKINEEKTNVDYTGV